MTGEAIVGATRQVPLKRLRLFAYGFIPRQGPPAALKVPGPHANTGTRRRRDPEKGASYARARRPITTTSVHVNRPAYMPREYSALPEHDRVAPKPLRAEPGTQMHVPAAGPLALKAGQGVHDDEPCRLNVLASQARTRARVRSRIPGQLIPRTTLPTRLGGPVGIRTRARHGRGVARGTDVAGRARAGSGTGIADAVRRARCMRVTRERTRREIGRDWERSRSEVSLPMGPALEPRVAGANALAAGPQGPTHQCRPSLL